MGGKLGAHMIAGLELVGVSAPVILELLELAVRINTEWYRRTGAPPIHQRPDVLYVPDRPSAELVIVAAQSIRSTVSCGSASAAYAGWLRAQNRRARCRLRDVEPGLWHAFVEHRAQPIEHVELGTTWQVWDPAAALRRGRRSA